MTTNQVMLLNESIYDIKIKQKIYHEFNNRKSCKESYRKET